MFTFILVHNIIIEKSITLIEFETEEDDALIAKFQCIVSNLQPNLSQSKGRTFPYSYI